MIFIPILLWSRMWVFICVTINFGAILRIRTGPADFSAAFRAHIKHQTPYCQQGGEQVLEAASAPMSAG
jgi:hypothetical protein